MNGSTSPCYPPGDSQSGESGCLQRSKQMLALLKETERCLQRNPDAAAAYLHQAMALLAAKSYSETLQRRTRAGLAGWQLALLDDFIKKRLDQCIRTTELASLLGLSVSHFSHAFKRTTGMTAMMYVAARRVEAAGNYMLRSAHSLSDIALSHGFCDQSHFCRVFRRETGFTPQTWRKLHALNPHLHTALRSPSSRLAVQAGS